MNPLMHYTFSSKVAEIFDLYTELHDIRITLFSPDGKLVYPDQVGRPNCAHCRMLREDLSMDSQCRKLDRKMMMTSLQRGTMVTYTCHAGMREATAPVFVEDGLVGYVMLGQFRSETSPEESPYARHWEQEMGNKALQGAYRQTAVFPEQKIETLLSMFQHLLEFIIESQLIRHRDYDLVGPAIEHIHRQPDVPFSLEAASSMVGRSPSTVTRLFRKVTGMSFKQYQTAHRLEQAATMLRSMPNRPVAEIAQGMGYEDPLYFSRVFHRHFKCSPSAYRRKS